MNVINLGFPRTGTQSLGAALKILDYKPFTMSEALSKCSYLIFLQKKYSGRLDTPCSKVIKGYDAMIGMPLCFQQESLYKEFSHAKYIVLLRDPEAWYKSMSSLAPESVSYRFGRRFGAQKLKTFSLRCSLLGGLGPASITLMNFLSVQVRFTLI
ncbi:MAG: hypothetical protein GKR87_08305 [Kiritimatiellae bacterium]|nr:hypothetical protein [Kiritimatiellia bacterium]